MWPVLLIISTMCLVVKSNTIPEMGIHRHLSEGEISKGYKVMYGDEDISHLNELVNDEEKWMVEKQKQKIKFNIEPLDNNDLKCLVSLDWFCSAEMKEIKGIMIQAVNEDCKHCTVSQRERTGRILVSLMAHHPVAWKIFLTRYVSRDRLQRILG